MIELKKKVNEIIKTLNKDWTDAITEGATSGEGIDLASMFSKFSDKTAELDSAFNEAGVRIYGKGKKGMFGK